MIIGGKRDEVCRISREHAVETFSQLSTTYTWCSRIGCAVCIVIAAVQLWAVTGSLAQATPHGLARSMGDVVMLTPLAVVLFIASRFFSRVADSGRPFEQGRITELRRIGRVLCLGGGFAQLWGALIAVPFLVSFGRDVAAAFDVDLCNYYLAMFGWVIDLLVSVFEYGHVLQVQDDELL